MVEWVGEGMETKPGERKGCAKLVESRADAQGRGDPQYWVPVLVS